MSLDGFIAGPGISTEEPLGIGGMQLHHWMFEGKTDTDAKIVEEIMETSGAVITGRRTYDLGIDSGWDGVTPFKVPAFVLSHSVPKRIVEGFTFVNDGIESAIAKARAVAGNKNIWIMGGANIAQQYIKARLLDEMQIHIAPALLGEGTRLFDHIGIHQIPLEKTRVIDTPGATHIRFRVVK